MYYNEPVEEQKCPKGCVDGGPGKSDYCGGQSLFNQNEKLSQCADHQYKEGYKKDLRALTADLIGEYKKAKKPVDKYYADAREEWREL
ncbi:hypothetical protein N7512_002579 [Penicillium capsulatum]|nr:hypothetical protein N7512_002579 [Penicillium capsulatum]